MSKATWSASRSREARRNRTPKPVKAKCLHCWREGWDHDVQKWNGYGCTPECGNAVALRYSEPREFPTYG